MRYNDFVIRILRAGKEGAGERVATAVREVQEMGPGEIGPLLPPLSTDGWKFARALPESPFCEMVLFDYYLVEEFRDSFLKMTITVLPVSLPGLQKES